MSSALAFTLADGVGLLTLARPDRRNALSKVLLGQLAQQLRQVPALGVHAVVIQGADGFFSAGADLADLQGSLADTYYDDQVAAAVDAIRAAPVPVIASIEGGCIGAALDLALACDFQVVAEGAFLELPAIRMGILYNPSALARIGRRLPAATLSRLLLAGERIVGRDALAAGLATHGAADGGARARASQLAQRMGQLPRRAVEKTKQFIGALGAPALDMPVWEQARQELLASPARAEAVRRNQARPGT